MPRGEFLNLACSRGAIFARFVSQDEFKQIPGVAKNGFGVAMMSVVKNFRNYLFVVAFVICAVLGQMIIAESIENQARKNDYAEINNIKYGLFSINQWKQQLSDIINAEVAEFDPAENKETLKPLIEAQLTKLIEAVDQRMQAKNKKSFKGRMKQAFINTFVDMKEVKEGVPQYADEIIKVMQKPKTKKNLKELVLDKVENYFEKTFEEQDLSQVEHIMTKYGAADMQQAKETIDREIALSHEKILHLSWALIAVAVLIFAYAGISREFLRSPQYISMVLILFVLLLCGVTTPMIDLEAKISEMSFVLMDHPVKFLNQILYFQTKSVLDVFWIMVTHADIQMKIVGILMVMFSVVFPVAKLSASLLFYYDHWSARKSKVINFLVHKSGKWSMTDVMIIAIFMAYIGFNGVISSQFGKLHSGQEEIVLLTTNGTSLQPGFYLFLAYTMLAMFLSGFLTRKIDQPKDKLPK